MKTSKILSITIWSFLLILLGIFYSCTNDSIIDTEAKDLVPLDATQNSIYLNNKQSLDINSPYYVSNKTQETIKEMSEKYHHELLETGRINLNQSSPHLLKGDDNKRSCCDLFQVVEQQSPYFVGFETKDRYSERATFLVNYIGYDVATGEQVLWSTWIFDPVECGTGTLRTNWHQVPIPISGSLHPTCPDPLVRAEFYLYIKYPDNQNYILCNYKFKVFPNRIDNPNDDACF